MDQHISGYCINIQEKNTISCTDRDTEKLNLFWIV